jgi:colicin import membrane protein
MALSQDGASQGADERPYWGWGGFETLATMLDVPSPPPSPSRFAKNAKATKAMNSEMKIEENAEAKGPTEDKKAMKAATMIQENAAAKGPKKDKKAKKAATIEVNAKAKGPKKDKAKKAATMIGANAKAKAQKKLMKAEKAEKAAAMKAAEERSVFHLLAVEEGIIFGM